MRHPASHGSAGLMCAVEVSMLHSCALQLDYRVTGDTDVLKLPPIANPERADNLWQTTCFELFVALDGGKYAEFNFSPSTCWAAYRFEGYRNGMQVLTGVEPVVRFAVEREALRLTAILDLGNLVRDLNGPAGISAVLEQRDGKTSWWALNHPSGKPDFHHWDCFALKLGAASES